MLADYISAGFDPDAFWRLTPRLYLVHMRGAAARREIEQSEREWLAWHIAGLSRMQKLPRFEQFSSTKKAAAPKAVPWEQQLLMWRSYVDRRKKR